MNIDICILGCMQLLCAMTIANISSAFTFTSTNINTLCRGLTVYRDQEFSGDMMQSHAVKRIEDVSSLRGRQFAEDAGPMSHPVRPDSYIRYVFRCFRSISVIASSTYRSLNTSFHSVWITSIRPLFTQRVQK